MMRRKACMYLERCRLLEICAKLRVWRFSTFVLVEAIHAQAVWPSHVCSARDLHRLQEFRPLWAMVYYKVPREPRSALPFVRTQGRGSTSGRMLCPKQMTDASSGNGFEVRCRYQISEWTAASEEWRRLPLLRPNPNPNPTPTWKNYRRDERGRTNQFLGYLLGSTCYTGKTAQHHCSLPPRGMGEGVFRVWTTGRFWVRSHGYTLSCLQRLFFCRRVV